MGMEEAECRRVDGTLPPIIVFLAITRKHPTAPITTLTNPVLNAQAQVCIVQDIAYNVIPTTFVISCKLIASC